MSVVAVEKPLQEKLGDEAVDSLVNLINGSQAKQKIDILQFVEDKFERRLSEEISGVEIRLTEKITNVDKSLSEKISNVETRLTEKITNVDKSLSEKISNVEKRLSKENASTRADLIKWMFIFWVGQVGFILGILFTFFKR